MEGEVARGGGEEAGLYRVWQPVELRGSDRVPLLPIAGFGAGDYAARAGEPQPPRGLGRQVARASGDIVLVVVLEAHAVAPGQHPCRVARTLSYAVLDNDPGLGPGHQSGHDLVVIRRRIGDRSGHRRQPGRDAPLRAECAVHEPEPVADDGAVGGEGYGWTGTGTGTLDGEGEKQAQRDNGERCRGQGAGAAESGPFLPEEVGRRHAVLSIQRRRSVGASSEP